VLKSLKKLNQEMRKCVTQRLDAPVRKNREFTFQIFELSPHRIILKEVEVCGDWPIRSSPCGWRRRCPRQDRRGARPDHPRAGATGTQAVHDCDGAASRLDFTGLPPEL